jgi:hypothetical protein
MVTNPDAKGIDPEDISITCGDVQEKAEDAKFNVDECADLMNNVDIFKACGCVQDPYWTPSDADDKTDEADEKNDKNAKNGDNESKEEDILQLPDMSSNIVCSICGAGYVVTMPDATGIDPDDEAITCGEVQELAEAAKFTAEECASLLNRCRYLQSMWMFARSYQLGTYNRIR